MSKVSVIIPIYNCENYIKQCLESVINQTLKDIEIICVDDCSKDNSAGIIQEYANQDTRIKLIRNEQNLGAALTRNKGLDAAGGKYIYFIDSDDWIDNDYLEKMLQAIEKAGTDIVLNLNIETNGAKYIHPTMKSVNPEGEFIDRKKAIEDAPVFIWARLYKKEFLDKYNLKYIDTKKCNDIPFHHITQSYIDKIFVFYGGCYNYNSRDESITGSGKNEDDRDFWLMRAFNLSYEYLIEHNLFDKNIKIFRVYPHYKVDTEEKFEFYKNFFVKIQDKIKQEIYNPLELYFMNSILDCSSLDEYVQKYNKSVTIGFLRSNR